MYANKKLLKYALFGGLGVVSDILLYSFLIFIGINYQLANISGYTTGTLISFFLNRQYTFKIKDKVFYRIIKFFMVAFVGYLSSVWVLYIIVEKMNIDAIVAKIISLFFILIIQFTLNKNFTFKEK